MLRRPSLLVRSCRALVGLATVWCLGCSSYEPLLDSLLGTRAGTTMICGSDMATASTNADLPEASGNDREKVFVSAPADARGYDCGCGGSCHAPSPILATVAPRVAPLPSIDQPQPAEPTSISRAPLLPPPQLAL